MERKRNQSLPNTSSNRSLLELNDYCLLEIFKYLEPFDFINLAVTCIRLKNIANSRYKKYSKLSIATMNGKDLSRNNVLIQIGHYIRVLNIDENITAYIWTTINRYCNRLKEVKIQNWHNKANQNFADFVCFQNVETLTLIRCNFNSNNNLLTKFRKLEHLNFLWVTLSDEIRDTKALFENNRNLKSFYYEDYSTKQYCDLRKFDLVQKLEALRVYIPNVTEYKTFDKFECLTKLSLWCKGKNVNDLLIQLAKKGIMEELELHYVQFDERSYDILKLFDKMYLLKVELFSNSKIAPVNGWPPNLKCLGLSGYLIQLDALLSIIKHLIYLENIDLLHSSLDNNLTNFEVRSTLSHQISKSLSCHGEQRKLNIILPEGIVGDKDTSKKYLVDSNGLRIFNRNWCKFRNAYGDLMFGINFNFDLLD